MTAARKPDRTDPIPAGLNWDLWLGVAAERPYLARYYHPGEWRKRIDFGTGTFGDMGCHILDPVFTSLALPAPRSIRSEGGAPKRRELGARLASALRLPRARHTRRTHCRLPGMTVTNDRLTR